MAPIISEITSNIESRMIDKYLAAIAVACTMASQRERESPGTFRYIFNEIMTANNIPQVTIPITVITEYERFAERLMEEEESVHEEDMIEQIEAYRASQLRWCYSYTVRFGGPYACTVTSTHPCPVTGEAGSHCQETSINGQHIHKL